MKESFYPIVVSELPEEDGGGFVAHVLDLYGCIGDGETPEAAIADAMSAAESWIAEMKRLGRDIPEPGSELERARREHVKLRKAIKDLVEQTDAIISEQSSEINRLICEVSDLRTEIMSLEQELHTDDDRPLWITANSVIARGTTVKGRMQKH